MQIDAVTRNEMLQEFQERARQMHRREQALLRAPVTAPERFSCKELRRLCLEAKEDFQQRR